MAPCHNDPSLDNADLEGQSQGHHDLTTYPFVDEKVARAIIELWRQLLEVCGSLHAVLPGVLHASTIIQTPVTMEYGAIPQAGVTYMPPPPPQIYAPLQFHTIAQTPCVTPHKKVQFFMTVPSSPPLPPNPRLLCSVFCCCFHSGHNEGLLYFILLNPPE